MSKPKLDFDLLFGLDPDMSDRSRSQARSFQLNMAMQFANALLQRRMIDQDTATDAMTALAGHMLEEAISDGENYAKMRVDGSFDKLREIAGGREVPNESSDGAATRMDGALRKVLGHLAREAYRTGTIPDRKFYEYIKNIDPDIERQAREGLGLDQVEPGSLDGDLRALSDQETRTLINGEDLGPILEGTTAKDRKAAAEAADRTPTSPSDWSESKLEKYFESRQKEEAAARQEFLGGDPDSSL
jgi:hypothetical protein